MSKRIVFFNHKGGVSKTTSSYHIGWKLAESCRVLLVDGDPQCNLTGLILGADFDDYYLKDSTRNHNIKDGVAPAFSGKPVPLRAIECCTPERASNLFLLAGHATLSEYDSALTFAQTSNNAITTLQNLPGAFSELLRLTEEKYQIDYTLIDLNPGLSAINQNLFLISDGFVIPTNPDPFSLMALETLEKILPRWATWKKSAVELFADSAYPLPEGLPKFLGTMIQRFNIRKGRAAVPYRNNIQDIKNRTRDHLLLALRQHGMVLPEEIYGEDYIHDGLCLSEIQDFAALLPIARDIGVPVFALTDKEIGQSGNVLDTMSKNRDTFNQNFEQIALKLAAMTSHA